MTFHAPNAANPLISPQVLANLRQGVTPLIASQELDGLFVDLSGEAIFPLNNLLIDGQPHPDDTFTCLALGLAIDSNSGKGGPERDGIAGVIFAVTSGKDSAFHVVWLDWEIQSLSQGGLAPWLQMMREATMAWWCHLRPLTRLPMAYVEPRANAWSIIEALQAQGLNPNPIDEKYVNMGKDARALAVEPHMSSGRVKTGRAAFDKRSNYRGVMANHLVKQVTGFHAFDKDSYKREDDLFDAGLYSVLVSLGDGTESRWSRLKRAA